MKISWAVYMIFEIVVITSLSLLTGQMIKGIFPEINNIVLVGLSLAGGYVLTYLLYFFFGIVLGLLAHMFLDNDQLEDFYRRNLKKLDDEEYDEYDDMAAEPEADEKQIMVQSATLDEISENTVGTYLEKQIPEWIKVNGEKYIFSHVLMKNSAGELLMDAADLETTDVIYPPGMVFKKSV